MSRTRINSLLGVKWFDGLVVGSGHLAHSDQRTGSLFAEIAHASLDQPGILTDLTATNTPSQLIQIESTAGNPESSDTAVTLTRPFVAIAPRGDAVVGHTSRGGAVGVPENPIRISLPPAATGNFLVCVTQVAVPDLSINGADTMTPNVQLEYPGLAGLGVAVEDYKERLVSECIGYVPIGLLNVTGGNAVVDQNYIPPLVKLVAANAFDDGLIPRISAHWDALFAVVTEKVDAAGAAFAQGQVGADIMSRRSDYESLRTLLLCTGGLARNVAAISPTRFLFEAVQPLARWWEYHRIRHFPGVDLSSETSPVAGVTRIAGSLASMTHRDLCAGSNALLSLTNGFLPGLREMLAVG